MNSVSKSTNISNINSVEVKNLSFHYPESEKMIFNNVNMSVPGGHFICLLGHSSCGGRNNKN